MHQKLIVIGFLGRDPEMRYTPAGQAVTNFSVATNRQFKDANGSKVKETTWFRITAWGKQAENCSEYLHKGDKVCVEGRLIPDIKTGGPKIFERRDGSASANFEVSASVVVFLSSKADREANGDEAEDDSNYDPNQVDSDEPIPF